MKMLNNDEFSVANRTALHRVMPLVGNAHDLAASLSEAGLNDTAELIARLVSRLMRQEQLLIEERKRSTALELQLASKLSILVDMN